jgi:PPOX class probable F420-dependent enzyme
MLVTTFKQDGTPVSAPVRVTADGDRVYFQTSNRSAISKSLRHTDWVQVVPCSVLGLYSYGQSHDTTARLLAGEEARRAAGLLASKYPARHRFLAQLFRRLGGRQMVHYELQADELPEAPVEQGL